jgi:hypothetical protein
MPKNKEQEPICDERNVPAHRIADVLRPQGTAISGEPAWRLERERILDHFATEIYGHSPRESVRITAVESSGERDVFGKGTRMHQGRLQLVRNRHTVNLDLLIALPAGTGPFPVFLGLNFYGNHTIHPDPGIRLPESWSPNNPDFGIEANRAVAASRGVRAHRWPVETILRRGFALATVYSGDIDPDFDDGFRNGVHGLFPELSGERHGPSDWGTIAAWSWGLSRVLDAFNASDYEIDSRRVAVVGHSRMGKAALWAGACDERFAMVIANGSGCAGAALSRRRFGERFIQLTESFPHWLCGRARSYVEAEDRLPVDQHQLLATIAPRPLYIASASEDLWADPRGEFEGLRAADPVFQLLAGKGFPQCEWPRPGETVIGHTGYHLRPGEHDLTLHDWLRFLHFADCHRL